MSAAARIAVIAASLLVPSFAQAQAKPFSLVDGSQLQKAANGVLSLMSYSVIPDITSSSLSISSASTGNPDLVMSQFGGGFTWSTETPLYLEGAAAYSRYDPSFVATNGSETRPIPVKWVSLSATGGIGWDFPIAKYWVFRPVFNFSLGAVTSDLAIGKAFINYKLGREADFLDGGTLNSYGLGGSLMLDYEKKVESHETDIELRLTNLQLQSFSGTSDSIKGHANSTTANLWARYRAPTGFVVMDRPLRYVLECSHSEYFGDQRGALGFVRLSQIGAGIEFDSSAYDIIITRTRLVARYAFGEGVSGVSIGFAVSF
ncbi:hypothetical protein GCM10025771_07730 [Niveibacterium umoris]|uniref:Autotransporter domain-containing protein n=1 Tax=Niveibacterium umoris TaxID=1193620 RepID=A0A840BL08_9RHOO|nr:hypothetical protein [Niveibacterium umoris]MBB4013680.1 hypothetical protein [Niveibacterium umoris]